MFYLGSKTFRAFAAVFGLPTLAFISLCQGAWTSGTRPSDAIVLTASNADKIAESKTAIIKINGMICESCEQSIQDKLRKMEGVRAVRISMKKGVAEVVYAVNGKATVQGMIQAIESLGEYKASVVKIL